MKVNLKDAKLFQTPEGRSDREYSQELDKSLGFKINEIEEELMLQHRPYDQYEGSQTWIGLNAQVFQTPYQEIYDFLNFIKPLELKSLVDLGAGYGRLAIVMSQVVPEMSFIGYEIMKERFEEGKRVLGNLELDSYELRKEDILKEDFILPEADVFFIYDFSDPMDIRKILDIIDKKFFERKLLIVARGKGIRSLIQSKYPQFFRCFEPHHNENYSIYSSFCDLTNLRSE